MTEHDYESRLTKFFFFFSQGLEKKVEAKTREKISLFAVYYSMAKELRVFYFTMAPLFIMLGS
jgi:hypothetical protein